MASLQSIEDAAEQYAISLNEIGRRRQSWNANTKSLIQNTLHLVKNRLGEIVLSDIDDSIENMESVYLALPMKPTGIVGPMKPSGRTPYCRMGGKLSYSMICNGKVAVWISYPRVEYVQSKRNSKLINIFEPDEIHHDAILEHVEMFIKELIEDESDDNSKADYFVLA